MQSGSLFRRARASSRGSCSSQARRLRRPGQVIRARNLLEASEQIGALERHRRLGGEHAHRRGDPAVAVDLLAPAHDQHRDSLLVAEHRLEVHRHGPGRLDDALQDLVVQACVRDEHRLLAHEHPARTGRFLGQRDPKRRSALEPVVRGHDEIAVRITLHQLGEARARDRARGGADHLAGDLGVGRPGELARGLGHGGHADDELARLLLADLELLRASQILRSAPAQLAHERLDREADDRSDADPEQRAGPFAGRVLGLSQDE